MIFNGILLTAAKQIKQERSTSSIYHLLTGSRSIQTLQDAHIFSNQAFFGIYRGLRKQIFDEKITALIQAGFLEETVEEKGRQAVRCLPEGETWLAAHQSRIPFHYFQGILYFDKADVFYNRLLLLVQTLSNTNESNFSFIPVIHQPATERFVRQFYKQIKENERSYLEELYDELVQLLAAFPEEEAQIFIDRFSGYNHYGKSLDQLAVQYNREAADIRLLLVGMIHMLLQKIEISQSDYSALYPLVADLGQTVKLVGSPGKTYDLFKQGLTPEEISRIRSLKINTIYDHLAEIALYDPAFPFSDYVSERDTKEILQAIQETNSFKLKTIKENVHPEISFFQIRLMLVFHHKLREGGSRHG